MASGISITCFAASYAVAFALEIARLLLHDGVRRAVMLAFAAAGLLAQTIYLCERAGRSSGAPLSSKRDWYLVAAWFLVVVYLYLTHYHPKTAFGLILMPLALGLIGAARFVADARPFEQESAARVWGMIHGGSILLATVVVSLGFMAGLMYLHQSYRLKRKRPRERFLQPPSLEWLQRTNNRAIVVAALLLGVGVLSGIFLNLILHDDRVPLSDPVVLSTLAAFTWLAISACAGAFYRPARDGLRVAYFTLVSFIFLALALGIGLFVESQHGGARSTRADPAPTLRRLALQSRAPAGENRSAPENQPTKRAAGGRA
jgi:ABC-type uncharacterized transport system permease subunit